MTAGYAYEGSEKAEERSRVRPYTPYALCQSERSLFEERMRFWKGPPARRRVREWRRSATLLCFLKNGTTSSWPRPFRAIRYVSRMC